MIFSLGSYDVSETDSNVGYLSHMSAASSINRLGYRECTFPESAPPQFTRSQQMAMSQFFERRLEKSVECWNPISSEDPIWERCISILITHYKRSISCGSTTMGIASIAMEVLNQQKEKGNLKQFFREHVLTSPGTIQKNIYAFINKINLNQDAQYTCLIPSNPHCIVNCKLLTENLNYSFVKSPSDTYATKSQILKGRLQCINEIDLLLNYTFEEKTVLFKQTPLRKVSIRENFSAECDCSIILPLNRKSLKNSIKSSVKKAFSAKVIELYAPIKRKQLIVHTAFTAAIALTVILFVKRYRFSIH